MEETSQRRQKIEVADVVLDPASREVWHAGMFIELIAQEYNLLELLARHAE